MSSWHKFKEATTELQTLQTISGILSWDQQTKMPAKAGNLRSQQLALLSKLIHEKMISPYFGDVIEETAREARTPIEQRAIAEAKRIRDRAILLPSSLVEAFTKAKSTAVSVWATAKQNDDYEMFAPHLKEMLELSRQRAKCLNPSGEIYDTLLDQYDPNLKAAKLRPLFLRLKAELTNLVQEAAEKPQAPPFRYQYTTDELLELSRLVLKALHFDLEAGRLDESAHPFTIGLVPTDVRLTTRALPRNLLGTLGGTIHECGHGLYEQGLPEQYRAIGLCNAAGASIHESQSRFYENMIGRSYEFFEWLTPILHQINPSHRPCAEELFTAAHQIKPSLIRVESDETTYNLHIIIRFELEQALLCGDLPIHAAAEAWKEAYHTALGIRPTTDRQGILQDVHWSMGYFGYFPSYTIGNLFSAGYKQALRTQYPTLFADVQRGHFAQILEWLRTNIHSRGNTVTQEEIVMDAIGQRDLVDDLILHLRERHAQAQRLLST